MSFEQTIMKRRLLIQKELNDVENQIASSPEGKLSIYKYKNGKHRLFHLLPENRCKKTNKSSSSADSQKCRNTIRNKKIYLNAQMATLTQDLAYKALLVARRKDLLAELRAIDIFLKRLRAIDDEKKLIEEEPLLLTLVGKREEGSFSSLAAELGRWKSETYPKSSKYPEHLTVPTVNGYNVRSKSEAMIDMLLTRYNIPFRYECGMSLGGITYYPDFMIRHPITGELYLWEHFGKIDDYKYSRDNLPKIHQFARQGFIAGKNFILTFETDAMPLDIHYVEDLIKYYFL